MMTVDMITTITSVTVFRDGARVTRSGKEQLVPGEQEVIIRGLSYLAQDDSFRVKGRGAAVLKGIDVKQRTQTFEPEGNLGSLIEELEELLNRIGEHRSALYRMTDLYMIKRDFKSASDALERYKVAVGDDPHFLREYFEKRSVLRIWDGRFRAAISDCFEAYQQALKTNDSMDIYRRYRGYSQCDYRCSR